VRAANGVSRAETRVGNAAATGVSSRVNVGGGRKPIGVSEGVGATVGSTTVGAGIVGAIVGVGGSGAPAGVCDGVPNASVGSGAGVSGAATVGEIGVGNADS
jgi:hypothetical protein